MIAALYWIAAGIMARATNDKENSFLGLVAIGLIIAAIYHSVIGV